MDPLTGLRAIVEELPRERLPEAIGALAEAQAVAQARLLANGSAAAAPRQEDPAPAADRLLNVNDTAELLDVKPRWLYRRSDTLPFVRRLGPRTLRFSEAGIRRWLATKK